MCVNICIIYIIYIVINVNSIDLENIYIWEYHSWPGVSECMRVCVCVVCVCVYVGGGGQKIWELLNFRNCIKFVWNAPMTHMDKMLTSAGKWLNTIRCGSNSSWFEWKYSHLWPLKCLMSLCQSFWLSVNMSGCVCSHRLLRWTNPWRRK